MDGLGEYVIVEDLFRILRKEEPIGPTEGPDTKDELYKAILPDDFFEKRRQEALKNKKFQAWLPVDFRKFLPGLRNAANLTGVIPIELNRFFDIPPVDRVSSIQDDIVERINDHSGVMNPAPMIDWFPIKLLAAMLLSHRKIAFYKRKFPHYFILTNLGRHKVSDFSTKDFEVERIFWIPPLPIKCPFFSTLVSHDNGVELTCGTDTDKAPFIGFINQLEKEIYSLEEQLSSAKAFRTKR